MKIKTLAACVLLAALFAVAYAQSPKNVSQRVTWEYQVIKKDEGKPITEAELNLYGVQGWELVTSERRTVGGYVGSDSTYYYFKRQR